MRINSRFQVLVFCMVIMIFSMPSFGSAQRNNITAGRDILEARTATQRDAQADTIQYVWGAHCFVLGALGSCVLGSLGIIVAYTYQLSPPPERCIGNRRNTLRLTRKFTKQKPNNFKSELPG